MNQKERFRIVALSKVNKIFSHGTLDEVVALKDINLKILDQDFITIIGSNGSGKSTLLNIVAGVFPPERGGSVLIDRKDVTFQPEYKHAAYVGRVWQDPGVGTAPNLTIEENLAMALLRGCKRSLRLARNSERKEKFRNALSYLGLSLEDRLNTLVGNLSGGQRQALSLVMATISNPSILLLDEHVATLDPNTAQRVLSLTKMIVEREMMTAMMVTHNMEIALKHGNRLIMMHKGTIVMDVKEEEKKKLTIQDLIGGFEKVSGEQFNDDKVLLSQVY